MSTHKSKETSAKKIAANRRNAQKSTGPGTPRARPTRAEQRQSRYVKSLYYDQAKLGENPDDFQEFLAELIADWQPVGAMEMTLVEDIATLEMERRLVDRAQRGRLVARLEREEAKVSRTARRLEEDATPSATREEIVAHGLRNAPDSSGKFSQIMELLEGLLAVLKIGDFSCPAEEIFATLYGEHPSWRAAQIINSYKHFVERYAEAPLRFPKLIQEDLPENKTGPAPDVPAPFDAGEWKLIDPRGPRPWGEPARAGDSRPSAAENEYHALHRLMLEEYDAVINDFRDFIRDRADLTRARRDSLLAPNGARSALMIRQKNSIDRHLERKTKLLLLLQKERRAREAGPSRESRRKSRLDAPLPSGRIRHHAGKSVRSPESLPPSEQAQCNLTRPDPGSRRFTRTFHRKSRSVPPAFALPRTVVLLARQFARMMGTASPSGIAYIVPIVLCFWLLQAGCANPFRPAPGERKAGSNLPISSRSGDPGRAEFGARRPSGAPDAPGVRDVFSHVESHQDYENKETASLTKANPWLSAARTFPRTGASTGNFKFSNREESAPIPALPFTLSTFQCDAFETVIFAA